MRGFEFFFLLERLAKLFFAAIKILDEIVGTTNAGRLTVSGVHTG